MNEIDTIQDLAARALPTPSLDAWPATEILADLLVARGVFTSPKWKGERFNAKDPATREAQRERGRDKLRRNFVTAARTWAICVHSRSYMTAGSYRVRLDHVGLKQSLKSGLVLIAEFTVLE